MWAYRIRGYLPFEVADPKGAMDVFYLFFLITQGEGGGGGLGQ